MRTRKRATLKGCKIYQTLKRNKKHISFHTPGHKIGKWDITELSFSDNLSAPSGCIAEAEKEIAEILGAEKSFILTDGSTSGVLATLYAAKLLGAQKLAAFDQTHKSFFNGCALLGITPLVYTDKGEEIPFPPTVEGLKRDFPSVLEEADGVFITSPTYYGRVADLENLRAYCNEKKKLLLVDGAHGGHLHFDRKIYAGEYADIWVDGVHKSLPSLTQGAVVSAKVGFEEALRLGVDIFRTTSPSYPIMASVEYAVKYPRNETLEKRVREFAEKNGRIFVGEDWTKVCARFGKFAFAVQAEMESKGIYPEFCDGNILTFYLSPATKNREWKKLTKALRKLFKKYPYEEAKFFQRAPAPLSLNENGKTEWVELSRAEGKICANDCGMFPPCTPLIKRGEKISKEKIELLCSSSNVYGLVERKILIFGEEERR